jgi:uncharacterized RDD family membrane protein YckC
MTNTQPTSDWFPADDEPTNSSSALENQQRGPLSVNHGSEYWTEPSHEEQKRAQGWVGDVPAASWFRRVGACAIDYALPFVAVPFVLVNVFQMSTTSSVLICFIVALVNTGFYRNSYGQSLGKQIFGIQVVRAVTYEGGGQALVAPSAARNLYRAVLHLLDALPLNIGFLWPLVDRYNRTWADAFGHIVHIRPRQIEQLPSAPPSSIDLI